MPFFDYLAINEDCDEVAGIVDAVNDEVALDTITDQGLLVLSLKSREEKKGFALEIKFFQRVKVKDLVVFSRQLAVMVSATLPVVQALRILVNQIESVALKIVVSEVADSVDGGARLSDALAKYPKVFSNFYVSMVKSGETAGKLDEVLNYLADQQEKDYDLISKTRGAMIYPAFILSGLVVVGFVMMIFVVPKLTEILKE
ncbi:MAG: type II secretion system F family protein, partial [Patescibacteria group bacterium]|nr:type II secretion system F family protein [Patescibacteria group bacterium]